MLHYITTYNLYIIVLSMLLVEKQCYTYKTKNGRKSLKIQNLVYEVIPNLFQRSMNIFEGLECFND